MKPIESAFRRVAILAVILMSSLVAPAVRAQKVTEKMAEDRQGFRQSVTEIRKQIDSTLSALNGIVEGKDASARKSSLKKYGSEIKTMEKEIEKTKGYAEKMRERGQDFFKDWEKSMKSVKNEDLKASATERRTTLKAQYDKVEGGIQKAKEVSVPFWKNLQDLEKYFANDTSDTAIATSAELVKKTNDDGKKIQGFIDEVVAAVDKIGAQAEKPAAEVKPAEGEAKPPEGEVKPPEGEVKPPEGGEVKPPEGEVKPPEDKLR